MQKKRKKVKQLQLNLNPKPQKGEPLSLDIKWLAPEYWMPNTAMNRKRWNGNRLAYLPKEKKIEYS